MGGYKIRKCEQKDIDNVLKLQVQWKNEDITYGFVPGSMEYLMDKLGEYFFVAEEDNEIVGFVYGTIHDAKEMAIFSDGQKYIEIDDIYICSGHRGNGAGSALLKTILETAKANNIEKSYIYSATKDIDSIVGFYREHGYKSWCIQMYK